MGALLESILSNSIGGLVSGGLNFASTMYQNSMQEQFYNQYMSPAARMAAMKAAGINPNAAAQGISGAPAPQLNSAPMSSAFTPIGEKIADTPNTAADTKEKIANAAVAEETKAGIKLDNDLKAKELGNYDERYQAELEDIRSRAAQQREQVENLKKQRDVYQAQIDKYKAEKDYTIGTQGLLAYQQAVYEAEVKLKNATAALQKAEEELARVNKEIAIKERDNYLTPEERIKMPIETAYNVDPIHADFTDAHSAIKSIDDAIKQCGDNELALWEQFKNNEISGEEYEEKVKRNDQTREGLRNQKREAERAYEKQSYKNGYHTWWQDNATSLIHDATTIVSAGIVGGAFKKQPQANPVGYKKY